MRIAISGSHCVGKSALIEEFLCAHPDYVHEPEPYGVLVEEFGEEFSSSPMVDDFYRQLEFNIARLRTHGAGESVIYERCPVDYLAYMLALEDLGRSRASSTFVESVRESVLDAMTYVDLAVYVPIEKRIDVSDEEDLKLRSAVDVRLDDLFCGGDFDFVRIVEVRGTTAQRLESIEALL
jgi:hypothetical protein